MIPLLRLKLLLLLQLKASPGRGGAGTEVDGGGAGGDGDHGGGGGASIPIQRLHGVYHRRIRHELTTILILPRQSKGWEWRKRSEATDGLSGFDAKY